MQVGATSAASAASQEAASTTRTGLDVGYDAFIKLLLAQLKNQDPMKPMDGTEYVSQLATLSNLEQVMKQSEKLDSLLQTSTQGQAAALVGMRVTSADGLSSGIATSVKVLSDGIAAVLAGGAEIRIEPGVSVSKP